MTQEIKWTLTPSDIKWEMDWSEYKRPKANPSARILAKPDKEQKFEEDQALAHLLMNEVVFINSNHWRDDWSEDDRKQISVNVSCNDVFAWGCADGETLPCNQIETLYNMWLKDPAWGPAVWCMIQRKQMPQKPVEKIIRAAGIWDLDKLNIGPNTMDAQVKVELARMLATQKGLTS
jgi:hypothetical protein